MNSQNNNRHIVIPKLDTNVRMHHRFRFQALSAVTAEPILNSDLIGIGGGVCSVLDSTFIPFCNSFKLKSIEVWTPLVTAGTPTTCSIEWTGTNNSPNVEVTDTTVTSTFPAHIKTKPPRNSLASFWQVGSSNQICILTAPLGSIIDVVIAYVMNDNEANSITIPLTTGVLGKVYYLGLCNNASVNPQAIGLTTTR